MTGCLIIQLCNRFGCNPVHAGFIDSPLTKLRGLVYSEAMKSKTGFRNLDNMLEATKLANAATLYPLK